MPITHRKKSRKMMANRTRGVEASDARVRVRELYDYVNQRPGGLTFSLVNAEKDFR